MLTIIMQELSPAEAAAPIVSQLSLVELFRTMRVHGEVPFIEPSPGTLLNLTHVERIYDDTPEQAAADEVERVRTVEDYRRLRDEGTPLPEVGECPHGYVEGTCSVCKAIADVEAQQPPDEGTQGLR